MTDRKFWTLAIGITILTMSVALWLSDKIPRPIPPPKAISTEFLDSYEIILRDTTPTGFLEPDYSKQAPDNPMMSHFKPCSTKVRRIEDSELVQVPAGWVRDVSRRINKLEAK